MSRDIASIRWRQRVSIIGTVTALKVRSSSYETSIFECTVSDGQAEITVTFTGYRSIAGIKPGRRIKVDGMVVVWDARLTILNPTYELLP